MSKDICVDSHASALILGTQQTERGCAIPLSLHADIKHTARYSELSLLISGARLSPDCYRFALRVRTSFDMLRCRRKITLDTSAIVQTAEKFERHDKFQGRKTKKKQCGRHVHESGL